MAAALRINQLSRDAYDWYARYLTALDSGDIETFRPFLHEDCIMHINNDPPLCGVNVILGALRRNLTRFERVEHLPLNIYGADRHFAVEMLWRFSRRDGARVAVPACSLVDRSVDGVATSIRLYGDVSAAFA